MSNVALEGGLREGVTPHTVANSWIGVSAVGGGGSPAPWAQHTIIILLLFFSLHIVHSVNSTLIIQTHLLFRSATLRKQKAMAISIPRQMITPITASTAVLTEVSSKIRATGGSSPSISKTTHMLQVTWSCHISQRNCCTVEPRLFKQLGQIRNSSVSG